MPRSDISLRACQLATLVGALVVSATSLAQTPRPAAPPAEAEKPEKPEAPATAAPAAPPRMRAPLLREGSHIVRVLGHLDHEAESGTWTFVIDRADPLSPGQKLIVAPNTLLEEMERMVAGSSEVQLVFEVTGEVTVFRGRNYLLLTHPPVLLGENPTPTDTTPTSSATGDSAADIIRELESVTGPVARRPPARGSWRDAEPSGAVSAAQLQEGTMIVGRRGRIWRTSGGAFQFIFDADAEGLADPPLTLLPCLLLERLARYAEQSGDRGAVIITGQATAYRNRNYLRPSVYRIPRERTQLAP